MRHARDILTAVVVIALAAGSAWASGITDTELIKWSQPVIRLPEDPNFIIGWDEPSMVNLPIAADDFQCQDDRPVTDVHWWGSFPDIIPNGIGLPLQPDGFLIRFWTDVPLEADPEMPWSHPGDVIHTVDVRNYIWEYAGYDLDLERYMNSGGAIIEAVDEAYQYNVWFDEANYFHQVLFETYWISIQAYWDTAGDGNVWGWKTRPHYWNDDAVVHDGTVIFDNPTGDPDKLWWDELWGPDDASWDLAFELSVPEPATMALLGVGGVAVLIRRRRRACVRPSRSRK